MVWWAMGYMIILVSEKKSERVVFVVSHSTSDATCSMAINIYSEHQGLCFALASSLFGGCGLILSSHASTAVCGTCKYLSRGVVGSFRVLICALSHCLYLVTFVHSCAQSAAVNAASLSHTMLLAVLTSWRGYAGLDGQTLLSKQCCRLICKYRHLLAQVMYST